MITRQISLYLTAKLAAMRAKTVRKTGAYTVFINRRAMMSSGHYQRTKQIQLKRFTARILYDAAMAALYRTHMQLSIPSSVMAGKPALSYVLDADGTPVPVGILESQLWLHSERHVGEDFIGSVRVSTVFLVHDHAIFDQAPVLFETMVFGGNLDEETRRYHTLEEAKAGHAAMVAAVREAEGIV